MPGVPCTDLAVAPLTEIVTSLALPQRVVVPEAVVKVIQLTAGVWAKAAEHNNKMLASIFN